MKRKKRKRKKRKRKWGRGPFYRQQWQEGNQLRRLGMVSLLQKAKLLKNQMNQTLARRCTVHPYQSLNDLRRTLRSGSPSVEEGRQDQQQRSLQTAKGNAQLSLQKFLEIISKTSEKLRSSVTSVVR